MQWMRTRLSFANVMSVIAVFIALGGTTYAAVTLPKNSVKAKQIAKNGVGASEIKGSAVRTGEVKNGSLLTQDFAAGQLPQGAKGDKGDRGDRGDKGDTGDTGDTGTFGSITTVFFKAPADLTEAQNNMSYGAFCPAGKVGIAGGGRGDDTLSEQTILTNTRPAISSSNTEPPLAGQGFTGWRITVVNPAGGAASGIKPEVWVVCATP
jgi:hypothetical protein